MVCASKCDEFAKKIRESFTVFKALNRPFQNSTVPLTSKACLHDTTQSLRAKSTISSTFSDKLHLGSDFLQGVMHLESLILKDEGSQFFIQKQNDIKGQLLFLTFDKTVT